MIETFVILWGYWPREQLDDPYLGGHALEILGWCRLFIFILVLPQSDGR